MATEHFNITGLDAVLARLEKAPSLLVGKALHRALDLAIGVVAAEVEARTPEGETGLLREAVITDVQVDVQKHGGTAAVGFSKEQSEGTGAPQDHIAYWVEFGHQLVSHTGKQSGHVPAHPFMRPAADASAERAIAVFAEALAEGITAIEE